MAFVYDTVNITSVDYPVYGNLEKADEYLEASMSEAAQAWRDLADIEDKKRYLVQMSRILDRQEWRGEKVEDGQAMQWPRKNTGVAGVVDDAIPLPIVYASFEGAAILASGGDFESSANQAQKIASLRAGSVALSYFRGAEGPNTRFPVVIDELIRRYTAGGDERVSGAISTGSTGTDTQSVTRQDFGYNRSL